MPVVYKYSEGQTVNIRVGVGRTPGKSHLIPVTILRRIAPARKGGEPRYAVEAARGGIITRAESKIVA